jgi:hypothetical protein
MATYQDTRMSGVGKGKKIPKLRESAKGNLVGA